MCKPTFQFIFWAFLCLYLFWTAVVRQEMGSEWEGEKQRRAQVCNQTWTRPWYTVHPLYHVNSHESSMKNAL